MDYITIILFNFIRIPQKRISIRSK